MENRTVTVPKMGTARLMLFDGMTEILSYARTSGATKQDYWHRNEETQFYGATCGNKLDQSLLTGQPGLVAKSDAVLRHIEEIVDIDARVFRTIRTVAGGAPIVPAVLAGHPKTMRQRRKVITDTAPVSIIVDATVSGGFSTNQITRRGAAALALARVVSRARPVSLWVYTGMQTVGQTVLTATRIDSAPLDLQRAAFALSAPEMLRRVGFALTCSEAGLIPAAGWQSHIKWAFNSHNWQEREMPGWLASQMGIPSYVAVSGAYIGTADLSTNESAAKWVQDRARELLAMKDAA